MKVLAGKFSDLMGTEMDKNVGSEGIIRPNKSLMGNEATLFDMVAHGD